MHSNTPFFSRKTCKFPYVQILRGTLKLDDLEVLTLIFSTSTPSLFSI